MSLCKKRGLLIQLMKLRYLVLSLCLLFYCHSSSMQELSNNKDFNGYEWRRYSIYGFYGDFLKYARVVNVLINSKYVSARIAHFLKSSLSKENQENQSRQADYRFVTELDKLLDTIISNDDYSGVDVAHYVDGLDDFYQDSRNRAIPIHLAMIIIKRKITGYSPGELENYIRELRKKYSESKG
jgi:hypothetical protein